MRRASAGCVLHFQLCKGHKLKWREWNEDPSSFGKQLVIEPKQKQTHQRRMIHHPPPFLKFTFFIKNSTCYWETATDCFQGMGNTQLRGQQTHGTHKTIQTDMQCQGIGRSTSHHQNKYANRNSTKSRRFRHSWTRHEKVIITIRQERFS